MTPIRESDIHTNSSLGSFGLDLLKGYRLGYGDNGVLEEIEDNGGPKLIEKPVVLINEAGRQITTSGDVTFLPLADFNIDESFDLEPELPIFEETGPYTTFYLTETDKVTVLGVGEEAGCVHQGVKTAIRVAEPKTFRQIADRGILLARKRRNGFNVLAMALPGRIIRELNLRDRIFDYVEGKLQDEVLYVLKPLGFIYSQDILDQIHPACVLTGPKELFEELQQS